MPAEALPASHRRRLKDLWRSAGWPCHDGVELDLLTAGLIERHWDTEGRETLRLTDAGLRRCRFSGHATVARWTSTKAWWRG